jgi:hypothetical protein
MQKSNDAEGTLCDRDLLESAAQVLLLLLHLLFKKELCIARLGVVDTAFSLRLALPSARSLVFSGGYWLCRVPVTNTLVAPVQKIVVWDVVGVNVCFDLRKAPVGQGVDLDEAVLCDLNDGQGTSCGSLATASTSQHCLDLQFGVGTLGRLDLRNVIVQLVVGVPEFVAVLPSEVGNVVAAGGLVHVDRSSITSSNSVDQLVSLVKVVQGVQENQVDVVLKRSFELGKHIHGDKASEAKSSCLEKTWQSCDAPFQYI